MNDSEVHAVGNALCLIVTELRRSEITDFSRFGRLLALVGTVADEEGDPEQGRILFSWAAMMNSLAREVGPPESRPN